MQQPAIYFKTRFPADSADSSLTEADLWMLWNKLHEQNILRVLVISNTVSEFEDFLHMLLHGEKYVTALYDAETNICLGFAWFEKVTEGTGLIHFSSFKEGIACFDAIGYAFLEEMFIRNNPAGVSFIHGHIPARYPAVHRFAERMGFVDTGRFRNYIRKYKDGSERSFPAKVYATHVAYLRKHLEKISQNVKAKIMPCPNSNQPI